VIEEEENDKAEEDDGEDDNTPLAQLKCQAMIPKTIRFTCSQLNRHKVEEGYTGEPQPTYQTRAGRVSKRKTYEGFDCNAVAVAVISETDDPEYEAFATAVLAEATIPPLVDESGCASAVLARAKQLPRS
jgi:hypothetical protein